jgi:alpha-L-rhamnosidase
MSKGVSGVRRDMKNAKMLWLAWGLVLGAAAVPLAPAQAAAFTGPVELRVDNLKTPLGIDDPAPRFSWQLQDPARGARQTAYQVLVASRPELLRQGKPDVWDSGRIESGASLNVLYAGPAIAASSRYFWLVKVWDTAGMPYAESETNWWETGLLSQDAWRGQWIGFETAEEAAVRRASAMWIASPDAKALAAEKGTEQHFAYRATVTLDKPVLRAALHATGQDTVAAWVNGAQVLKAGELPPWKQMPWKKFVRAEVADKLSAGANSIAIESIHYVANPNGMATADAPPLIATLVVEYTDGTTATFSSSTEWKTAIHPASGWERKAFDDSNWKRAVEWAQAPGPELIRQSLGHPWIPDSVKRLRHAFTISSPVKAARLYATALGGYEMSLNGQRVGDQVLAPGWTDYRQRVVYQAYDVTDLIAQGDNTIGALLAPGWYSTALEWFQQPNNYGDKPPALRAQLRIEHVDGSVEWVATDAGWQASLSDIFHSELYDGETLDYTRESDVGWSNAGFPDDLWHERATVIDPAPVMIVAQDFPPVRVERTLEPKAVTEPKPGAYVYDFGQNFSGVVRVLLHNPAETKVQIRFAEVLNPDGTLYTDNLRTARATDSFTLNNSSDPHDSLHKLEPRFTFYELEPQFTFYELEPQFTFHGFRYAELTGLPAPPSMDAATERAYRSKVAVTGLVLHTDAPFTAKLETGSAMINQLWSNILWGQRSNFVGVPTDCPQRDERLGWMGDAEVFWRAASYNMDLAAFSRKFAGDMRGTQAETPYYSIYAPGTAKFNAGSAAGWSDAGVIVPWTSWLQTGDTSVIEQNWAAMERYLNAIEAANPDGLWKHEAGTPFGDWLSPEGKTDYTLIATAYWAYDATLMQQMARATGRAQDAEKYARIFEKIRAAFQKQFVRADGFVAGADNTPSPFGQINNPNAKSNGGDTQTGYVLALHMNLVPENLREAAAQKLVDKIEANRGLLGTGFLGTPYLLEELTKSGHAGLAYQLLLNTDYPSWGYLVKHGATTMWERWNGDQMKDDPSMNSFNHYAYGAVADWIYRFAAGVDASPLDAGFHTVVLHPVFDSRMGHVAFDYASAYGPIHSDWTVKGTTAEWHVTIPANTRGWLSLNAREAGRYSLEGIPLARSKQVKALTSDTKSGFELEAGSYTFAVEMQ